MLGEMDDLFARRVSGNGRLRAGLWYVRQIVQFRVRLTGSGPGQFRAGPMSRLQSMLRDGRHGMRVLMRHPVYTVASVVTLGIGIGGVTAVYAVANWVLLRPVPGVATPNRLAKLQLEVREGGPFAFPISAPDLRQLSARIRGVRRLAASTEYGVHVEAAGSEPRRLTAEVVTPDWFEVLGLRPLLGRAQAGEAGTVVVSDRLWHRAWGGSRTMLGSDVRINGHGYRVVGVAPAGFRGAELPGDADLWLPESAFPVVDPSLPGDVLNRRSVPLWRDLVGELTPDATREAIAADAERVIEWTRQTYGATHSFLADFVVRTYPGIG
ncbi:MAG: ABC transporter permease, partial [Gemmatimonadota bacterium]